jgi:hypothetical protein
VSWCGGLEWKEIDVGDVQIALSVLVVVILAWACVTLDRINQRIVKIESRDFNKDLRMVWDKIRANDAENTLRDHRIVKLESEEYFGDEDDIEDDSDYIDVPDYEDCSVYYFVEKAVNAGHFVHLGKAYRITIDKNEG